MEFSLFAFATDELDELVEMLILFELVSVSGFERVITITVGCS